MNIIELHNIDKTYHGKGYEVHALRNVSVTVKKGELLAVMGTSGSGKTTLLNILGMIDSFDSGKYTLNGTDVFCMNEKELAAMRNKTIGFVNQDFALIDRYSVKKNVELPLRYMGGAGKGKKARIPEMRR